MASKQTKIMGNVYQGVAGACARVFDRLVGVVAPGMAHGMLKRRMQHSALLSYEAARVDRMMPGEATQSPDAELLPDLPVIRARSRRQVQDDAHASSAVQVYVDAVIGDGVKPQSSATKESTGRSEAVVEKWRKQCHAYFAEWADGIADASGHGSFYDLQALVARTRKVDGECFTHAVVGGDNMLTCEVIDADRIGNPDNKQDDNQLRSGVVVDTKGRAVNYWVASAHPDDLEMWRNVNYAAVPVSEGALSVMQHTYRVNRPGQSRGVPDGASSFQYLEHLHHYLKSEIIGARAASNFAMFIKKSVSATDPDINPVATEGDGALQYHEKLESGTIAYLNEGEEPVPFNPSRPGAADSFVIRMLRAVAAGQGMSYERMTRDYGGMNYSSMRGMLKEEQRGFDRDRNHLNRSFNQPWWRNVIRHGVQTGRIDPPAGYADNPEPWLACQWIPPAYGWVDPVKEIKAAKEAIDANLSTPWHEAGRAGLDPMEILDKRGLFLARAAAKEIEYGLVPGSLTGGVAVHAGEDDADGVEAGRTGAATPLPPKPKAEDADEAKPVEDEPETADPVEDETDPADEGDDETDDEGNPVTKKKPAVQAAVDQTAKQQIEAMGSAVRSGTLSPSLEVEEATRVTLGLPPVSEEVKKDWQNNPVRKPATLAPATPPPLPPAQDDEA